MALTFLGLSIARPIVHHGAIDTVRSNTITDRWARWKDGQFEGINGPHYIEITSGQYTGVRANIVATEITTRTLVLDRDCSNLSGGEGYVIRPHWTLASLFGPGNEAGLETVGKSSPDQILLLDPHSQEWTIYHYQTVGLGGVGWRSSIDFVTDQSNAKVDVGQGFIVRRSQPDDLVFKVLGTPITENSFIEISPGVNIVANVLPTDLKLAESGLYTGDPETGLAGGFLGSADTILVHDGGKSETFYYRTSSSGGTGWRSTESSSVDASQAVIPAGAAFMIERRHASPFLWEVGKARP